MANMIQEKQKFIVIDFDSTFMKVEALEELAAIIFESLPVDEQNRRIAEIKRITDLGVDGEITFNESLSSRLALLSFNKGHLDALIERLKKKVSTSFSRNKAFFEKYQEQIYIVSNGFKEFIDPVVADYYIPSDHVCANTFLFDEVGHVTGFDQDNPLAHSKGKSRTLQALDLPGEIVVIGDSYTDYEMKEAGIAHKFYAFTENVLRENILDRADHITPSLDEFLYVNKMPMATSYPKSRIKVLLLENIHQEAEEILSEEGFQVERLSHALSEDELIERIKGLHVLGIRSKTQVTARVLEHANRLMAVCAFCIGTKQIDLKACAQRGVAVFNAPYSNTRSVVELAIGEIIMLMRRIPYLNHDMHQHKWSKTAKDSFEVRGKKLGIVGYGNIGKQLSVLAEAIGMDVYYYDTVEQLALGNATKCRSLEGLLSKVDVVSLHVDDRPENHGFFDAQAFDMMKEGSILVNLSRGFVVDMPALKANLESGKLRGAAIDVFPKEPKSNNDPFESELPGLPNLILTPHIGGSTQEAQQHIGNFVPSRIMAYINSGNTEGAVNFPQLQLPELRNAHRLIHIHHNMPGVMSQINTVLASHNINIMGQYLKTTEEVGYVILDINKKYSKDVLEDMKQIEGTIKFRVLY